MSTGRSHRARVPCAHGRRKYTSRAPRLLRGEQLEPRTVLAALSPMSYPHVLAIPPGGQTGLDAKTPTATPPTVTKPATAGVNSSGYVTGKTTTLSVLGNDAQGASTLIYNWTVTSTPAGGSTKFSVNGTNTAQNDTVTFSEAGVYGLKVTIVDPSGLSVTSSLNVTVVPALTSISLYSGANVLVNSNSLLDVTGTSQTLRAVALDQFGNQLATQPSFSWSPTLYPAGAKPLLAGSGNTETLTFGKAGSYGVSVSASGNGGQVATSAAILVLAEPTYIAVNQVGGSAVVSGTSAQFTVSQFQDQFHNLMSTTTTLSWTATTLPGGAAVPQFAVSGSTTTVNFSAAGTYVLAAKETDASHDVVSQAVTVTVKQTLTSIVVTPGTASIQSGATQQFNAQGLDQFQRAMTTQPTFAWSASGGKIGSTWLFTAPSTAGTYNVAAGYPLAGGGSVAGGAKVTVAAPSPSPAPNPSPTPAPGGLKDPVLAALVQKLDADGSLNRADMIQILTSVGTNGTVSATDLSDLKTILADAAQYNMPNYVQVLAGDVVNGNPANAQYQRAPLGNLAAGSSAAQLDKLIDKWFLGTDLPALTSSSLTYTMASGSLFPNTPSHNDEFQGELGDCYFISSLGTIADSNPAAIENMFINNGDGTYTVRFYGGSYGTFYNSNGTVSDGFTNGAGTADYVTVNCALPTYSNGVFVYADYGFNASSPTNSLWIPLAEKAYAEWNATGNEGRDGQNAYASIEGGWMATVDAQVLGHNATDYNLTASTQQAMISALAAKQAVTIGTDSSNNSADTLPYGLYGSHAYAVIGYNASANLFTLYNPWGCDQPGVLSWSQLEATCGGFVTAATTGSAPISSGNLSAPLAAAASIPAAMSGALASPSVATKVSSVAAWTTVPASAATSAVSLPAASGIYENHSATVVADRSVPHVSAANASDRPVAAGVDAVLAGEDLDRLFAAKGSRRNKLVSSNVVGTRRVP